ncbi:MAG: winged helix-turn-helix transcriptional regulator [Phocaeicola sp.]
MEYQPDKNNYLFNDVIYTCSLDLAIEVIGGKWKAMILYHLQFGSFRSSELRNRIIGISNKVFTNAVRDMEKAGLISRKVYPTVPPKVEYELTELGSSLIPQINELSKWGKTVGTVYSKPPKEQIKQF